MDASTPLTAREASFLKALLDEHVPFLVVGLAAAALQGVPAVTQDVDLWFADLTDAGLRRALSRVGASYVPPSLSTPPLLVGGGTELFDIVVHMHGLESFEKEAARALAINIGGLELPVLPLERIIESKRATARPKDLAILPALEEAAKVSSRRQRP